MNHFDRLRSTRALSVFRFHHGCHSEPHYDPHEEQSGHFSINFVDRRGFSLARGKLLIEPLAGDLFVTRPGLVYQCRHDSDFPQDVCCSVVFNFTAEEVYDWSPIERSAFSRPYIAASPRTHFYRYLLARRLDSADPLALEEVAVRLPTYALQDQAFLPVLRKRHRLEWYSERVANVAECMRASPEVNHTLSSLADSSGMSRHHLVRVFHQLMGEPPHKYLVRRRLVLARRLLEEGASVTESCFSSGFGNLSHFTRAFAMACGAPPGRWLKLRKKAQVELSGGR
jgi:AraC-like DNA-binding protein